MYLENLLEGSRALRDAFEKPGALPPGYYRSDVPETGADCAEILVLHTDPESGQRRYGTIIVRRLMRGVRRVSKLTPRGRVIVRVPVYDPEEAMKLNPEDRVIHLPDGVTTDGSGWKERIRDNGRYFTKTVNGKAYVLEAEKARMLGVPGVVSVLWLGLDRQPPRYDGSPALANAVSKVSFPMTPPREGFSLERRPHRSAGRHVEAQVPRRGRGKPTEKLPATLEEQISSEAEKLSEED